MLELKQGPMRAHDYTTLFKLEHMLKDLRLCLQEAEAAGVRMELVRGDRRHPRRGGRRGLGEQDFAALLEVVEERAGARLEPAAASGRRRAARVGQAAAAAAADEVHDQRSRRAPRAKMPGPASQTA